MRVKGDKGRLLLARSDRPDLGPEPTTSKAKAFGRREFSSSFRHEFELLRRTKEAEREQEEGKTTRTKRMREGDKREDDKRGKGVKTVVIGGS